MTDLKWDDQESAGLQLGLKKFEAQWKRLQLRLGAGRFLMAVVGLLLIAALIDGWLGLEGTGRWVMTLLFYLLVAASAWVLWWGRVLRPLSPEQVAWMIETAHPDLNEKLISAVELEKERGRTVSRALILQMIRETEVDIGKVDPERDLAPPRWLKLLPAVVGLVLVGLLAVPGLYLPLRIKRIVVPSRNDAAASSYRLRWAEMPPARFAEDSEVRVSVTRSRKTEEEVVLEVRGEQNRRIPLGWNEESQKFEGSFPGPDHAVELVARSGRASTRRVKLMPMLRPWIEELTLEVLPPAYTGEKLKRFDTLPRELSVVAGSELRLRLLTNEPLASVVLESESGSVQLAAAEGREVVGSWIPESGGELVLRLRDTEGLAPKDAPRMRLRIEPDRVPEVVWVSPENDILMREGDSLPLVWRAEDDFGVVESRVSIRKNADEPVLKPVTAVEGAYRLDLSDWYLGAGDRLEVRAEAEDALGQRGESVLRTLSVAGGLAYPEAQAYLQELDGVAAQLAAMQQDVNALLEARAGLFEAAEYQTPSALENEAYNRVRWQLISDRLDRGMNELRDRTGALKSKAFFDAGDPALDVLSRYIEQERTRLHAEDPFRFRQGPGVEGVWELGMPLVAALQVRAAVALPALQAQKLSMFIEQVAPRLDPVSRRLLMDLRHRAAVFADRYAPERADTLRGLDLTMPGVVQQSGLIRETWPGRREYVLAGDEGGGNAVRVSTVAHGDLMSMGLKENQVASLRWRGTLKIEKGGEVGFELESDDGSRLYINGELVVRNDGNHGMQKVSSRITLPPGEHAIQIVYFNSGGGGGLIWRWNPPGQPDWQGVPEAVLLSRFDQAAASLAFEMGEMRRNLEREAGDLNEIKDWMRRIQERLEASGALRRELQAEAAKTEWTEALAVAVQAEAEALRSRAVAADDERLARVADELAQAAGEENREGVLRALEAAEAVIADQAQAAWEKQIREEMARVEEVMAESAALREAGETPLQTEIEQADRVQEQAGRLDAMAGQTPEAGDDRDREKALREVSREMAQLADRMREASGPETDLAAAVTEQMERLEEKLAGAEAASEAHLQAAEESLEAARSKESERMADMAARLRALNGLETEAALAALQAEKKALQEMVAALQNPLNLARENEEAASPEAVRNRRLAALLDRETAKALSEAEHAARRGDTAAVSQALAEVDEDLRQIEPLLAGQEKAAAEALTRREEEALSEAVREASAAALTPEEAEQFDEWERMASAREAVERLAGQARALNAEREQEQAGRLADEVTRAARGIEKDSLDEAESTPWTSARQEALDEALRRMQPMQHEQLRAEAAGKSDSEARKAMEDLFRDAENFQKEMAAQKTPESERLQEMAEAVARQARANYPEGAGETLRAMERQVAEWAREAGEEQAPNQEKVASASEQFMQAAGADRTDHADQADGQAQVAVSEAVGQMSEAASALRGLDAGAASEALESAALSLALAESAMSAQLSGQPGQPDQPGQPGQPGASGQPGEAGQGQSSTPSMTQGGGVGDGGSQKESEGGLEAPPGEMPEGQGWDGAVSDLPTGDRQRGGNQYSPYYRRAIQQYMQDLQKEQQE